MDQQRQAMKRTVFTGTVAVLVLLSMGWVTLELNSC